MARRPLIAANWKMHKTIPESLEFVETLKPALADLPACDLAIFPPFLSVPATAQALSGSDVIVGTQDIYFEPQGAFTGEISGAMIRDAGCTHVIIGHSERRHVLGENDDIVCKKLKAARDAGLVPVFCVGEKLEHREAGEAESYVGAQMKHAFDVIDGPDWRTVVVAYEPVWAIGTGKTATPDDAEAMHVFVRAQLGERFGDAVAEEVRILYGGSVKPGNAAALLGRDNIDGALIGGASLEADSFVAIAQAS